jgi:hypothetical protein
MNLQESIRRILREESESRVEKLKTLVQQSGVEYASKMVGGTNNLINILYDGDIKKFYQETDYVPYKISDSGMIMYIDDLLVNYLELKDSWGGKEKLLGDFVYGPKGRVNYRFTAKVYGPFTSNNGQVLWKVVGTSGDSGFGYSFISKRNTLGKRARIQIFQQIIDKYNLDSYLQ